MSGDSKSAEQKERRTGRIVLNFVDYLPVIIQTTGAAALAVVGVFFVPAYMVEGSPSGWFYGLVGYGVLGSIVAPIWERIKNHRTVKKQAELEGDVSRLEKERDEAKVEYMSSHELERETVNHVARELLVECGLDDSESRISVYRHEPERSRFMQIGRVSANPALEEIGRLSYPDNMGHIAQVWTNIKDHFQHKYTDPERWAEAQNRKYGLPLEIARRIKMKSRSYAGVRLESRGKRVGLIMAESMRFDGVREELLDTISNHSSFEKLAVLLEALPRPVQSESTEES